MIDLAAEGVGGRGGLELPRVHRSMRVAAEVAATLMVTVWPATA